MQKAEDVVSELTLDISDKQRVLATVLTLMKVYPDLRVERADRVTSILSIKFSSSVANSIADGVDIITQFAPVDDAMLMPVSENIEAWPYATIDNQKVYSNPHRFSIGESFKFGFGVSPDTYWEDNMEDAGISRPAIRAAKDYLRKNPPISYSTVNDQDT